MPQKKNVKRKNSTKKKTRVTTRTISGGKSPLFKIAAIVAIVVVGAIGSYALVASRAETSTTVPNDNVARGLVYKGLKADKENCGDGYVTVGDTSDPNVHGKACTHPDPGPEGQDVRVRAEKIDKELAEQASIDATNPPLDTNAPPQSEEQQIEAATLANNTTGGGSLGAVTPRNWPCYGTGTDGNRVQMAYVYPYGGTNRLSTLRSGFESIARRMNAVVYNSAVATGDTNGEQIRFATSSSCVLSIAARSVTGDITSAQNIIDKLRAAGYTLSNRKYVIWVDATGNCGQGQIYSDSTPGQTNANNNSTSFAMIWRGCWNYGEPHEFGHTLGAVQLNAPHHTPRYHCYDQNDVMCYNDGSGVAMKAVCTSSAAIWRYDCGQNDYFDAYNTSTTNYLATHWNIAKNKYLIQ